MAFYATNDRASEARNLITFYKTAYALSIIYPLASLLPKLSLCVLYLRVFDISSWARRATYSTMAFLTANAIAWLVPTVVVCRPISAYWSLEESGGKCLDYNVFGVWISLPNIITDLMLLVLPLPILWRTRLSIAKRIGLIITFATSSVGIIGPCLRLSIHVHRTYVEQPGSKQTTGKLSSCQCTSR